MKKLHIKGSIILVSDKDYARVKNIAWYIDRHGYANHRLYTPKRTPQRHEGLQRFIMRAKRGQEVDHLNGRPLDCRRSNLRLVSHMQNEWHRVKLNCNNTSGYRGVSFDKHRGLWAARAYCLGKMNFIGRFKTKQKAHRAYRRVASELYGKFLGVT